MRLSVVILNYNVRNFLHLCLQSVQHALRHIDAEIIVVDNNSHDDSCAMVRQYFPDVTLIENKENTGFPKGNNIGVAAAKGEYVCILNPDTVLADGTFEKLLLFADSMPDAGVTGIKLVDGRGSFLPESKRGVPTPWVAFTKIAGLYRFFPGVKSFNKYYNVELPQDAIGNTDVLVGAFMFLKRSLYLEVGGFDEDCFMYSDDLDLSYIVTKRGYRNFYYGQATAIHFKGESTVKDGTYMRRFREAMQFFYKKHFKAYPVFDLFMRCGAFAFMMVKKNRKGSVVIPQRYVLISNNATVEQQLALVLEKPLHRVTAGTDDLFLHQKGTEVIFDADIISYGDMITFMEKYANRLTYKIRPSGARCIIGSNSSDDRGTVINF